MSTLLSGSRYSSLMKTANSVLNIDEFITKLFFFNNFCFENWHFLKISIFQKMSSNFFCNLACLISAAKLQNNSKFCNIALPILYSTILPPSLMKCGFQSTFYVFVGSLSEMPQKCLFYFANFFFFLFLFIMMSSHLLLSRRTFVWTSSSSSLLFRSVFGLVWSGLSRVVVKHKSFAILDTQQIAAAQQNSKKYAKIFWLIKAAFSRCFNILLRILEFLFS